MQPFLHRFVINLIISAFEHTYHFDEYEEWDKQRTFLHVQQKIM